MTKNKLIILAGPTASGKTSVSIDLAKRLGGEIISADSMQVYKYMDVGTAKISVEEMQGVKHHLIDVLDPKEDFNIVKFQNMVKYSIEEIVKNGHIPILVGGTGFYIQSVIYDIDFNNEDDNSSVRKKLEEEYDAFGADFMHEKLKKIDIVSAQTIHKNNKKRIIRAIEYFLINNEPISSHNEVQREKKSPYDYRFFVLNPPRDILYERINKRVDIMLADGLVKEVENLYKIYGEKLYKLNIIGYSEIIDYLNNKISLDEASYKIKLNSRHYAKRQFTWFKADKSYFWFNLDEISEQEIVKRINIMFNSIA